MQLTFLKISHPCGCGIQQMKIMKLKLFCTALCLCVFTACEKDEPAIPEEPVVPPTEQPGEPDVKPEKPQETKPIGNIINWNNEFIIIGENDMATVGNINWRSIAYGNGKYVVGGNGGYVSTSSNGKDWSTPNLISASNGWNINGIAYGNGKFIACATNNELTNFIILSSTNGISWSVSMKNTSGSIGTVVFGNGKFVCGGKAGELYISTNGTSWTKSIANVNNINNIAYGNGKFAAVGSTGIIAYSIDGTNWISSSIASFSLNGITYGNGKFVAVGSGSTQFISTDGISWSIMKSESPNITGLRKVAYNHNKFFAVGNNGIMATFSDSDGIWKIVPKLSNANLYNVSPVQ